MAIKVERNYLKLLAMQFMHLVPVVNGVRLETGCKVVVECDEYGRLGEAECTGVFECHVYELKDSVMAMCDGNTLSKDYLRGKYNDIAKVQCCRFRFIRRNDVAFTKLLDKELVRAGLEIVKQSSLRF